MPDNLNINLMEGVIERTLKSHFGSFQAVGGANDYGGICDVVNKIEHAIGEAIINEINGIEQYDCFFQVCCTERNKRINDASFACACNFVYPKNSDISFKVDFVNDWVYCAVLFAAAKVE
ncbi:hypothetical protein ACOME3_006727 [Neoechinorhynchus agilis]